MDQPTITVSVRDVPEVRDALDRAAAELARRDALLRRALEALSTVLSAPECPSSDPRTGEHRPWYVACHRAESDIRRSYEAAS